MIRLFKPQRRGVKAPRHRKPSSALASAVDVMLGLAALKPSPVAKTLGPKASATGQSKTPTAPAGAAAKPATSGRATPGRARSGKAAQGSSFRAAVHTCEHGERRYKIFTPASAAASAKPPPLLVMLHGCGQTPDDFAKGTRMNVLAEAFGVLVVYPAQPREAHANRCWNWFRRGDQGRGAGEPALIASLTRHIIERHGADPARVYVAGLSAGASMALIVAHAYPDLFAAAGAHSGLPTGAAHDRISAVVAMQRGGLGLRPTAPVPTIVFHGSADHVVNPRNGRLIAFRALEPFPRLGRTETAGQVPDGRAYVRTVHRVGRGRPWVEQWTVTGAGHAWAGGSSAGRFTDPTGPDASAQMLRFFLRHRTSARRRNGG